MPGFAGNFSEGFMVHTPAWHGLGEVLDDYPERERGMELAGHNFEIEESGLDVQGKPIPGWKALVKRMPGHETDGRILHIAKDSYGVLPNEIGWDMVDAIVGEGARYETAGTLEDGAECWVLAWLDEPVQIKGDDSPYLPFINVNWRHNGTGALKGRSTSIRVVCANTQGAAEAEGRRLDTDFTFSHTKNALERVKEAKMAILGLRTGHQEFIALAEELAKVKLTKAKVEHFIEGMIPLPPNVLDVSERVMGNVDKARQEIRWILEGPTVPDAHRRTGYGMWLAGVEYLDHVRDYKSLETKFRRSIMRNEPAKTKLRKLIVEVAR